MLAIILDSNLMLSTRIEKGLQLLGYEVRVTSNTAELHAILENFQPSLVVINYNDTSYDALEVTKFLSSYQNSAHILGYVAHGEIPQLRPAAYAAGCQLLVANSAITSKLSQLVGRVMSDSGTESFEE